MRVGIFCIMCHLSLGREKKALLKRADDVKQTQIDSFCFRGASEI